MRIVIADDHPVFRAGLRAIIEHAEGMELVAEASSANEAVDKVARWKPDAVVLDMRMPDGGGIFAARRIVADRPSIGVLMLTMHEDDESVLQAMRAGARGYAIKGSDEEDIVRAIRAVGNGDAIFGPAIADRVLELFAQAPAPAVRAFPGLTEREREILELLAGGASNGQIANRLGLSPKTIRNHVSNICNKLQVVDRAQAALRARDAGLGGGGSGRRAAHGDLPG